MSRKVFRLQVEIDIQAITCPGVWLCSNGKVSLQIYMLELCTQTSSYQPVFPIMTNESFVFSKTFYTKTRLSDLQKKLRSEWIYMEFVQWQKGRVGIVLATFQTTLNELLFPSTQKGSMAGVDLDLLMEASNTFPGTIAPKIEARTKTTIDEALCICSKPNREIVVNPKVLTSSWKKPRDNAHRKVCHSIEYSRGQAAFKSREPNINTRPPFRYRKAEDSLLMRKPQFYETEAQTPASPNNNFRQCRSMEGCLKRPSSGGRCDNVPVRKCSCDCGNEEAACRLCEKYEGYFGAKSVPCSGHKRETVPILRTTLFPPGEQERCCNIIRCCPESQITINEVPYECQNSCRQWVAESKPSLTQKLHAKLTNTLRAVPKTVSCMSDPDDECDGCICAVNSKGDTKSRMELYQDLHKFYGDLIEKARNNACVPDQL